MLRERTCKGGVEEEEEGGERRRVEVARGRSRGARGLVGSWGARLGAWAVLGRGLEAFGEEGVIGGGVWSMRGASRGVGVLEGARSVECVSAGRREGWHDGQSGGAGRHPVGSDRQGVALARGCWLRAGRRAGRGSRPRIA